MPLHVSRSLGGLLIGVSALGSLVIFFRYDLWSHFNIVYGDIYDGDIEVSILEHWFNAFRELSVWSQTFAFYPAAGTLGYNDGYFIFGVIYSITRSFGADPFLSSEFVNISIKLTGFIGFYLFSHKTMGNSVVLSSLGASIFVISNNSYIQGGHAQLFTVSFAPLLASMLFAAFLALEAGRKAALAVWSLASSVLYAAWLMTAFYTAWFFSFFCLILLISLLIATPRQRLWSVARQVLVCRIPLVITCIVLILLSIPFFSVYIPRAAETGMHSTTEIREFLLNPSDVLALGGHSLLYYDVLSALRPDNSEHSTGFTPALLLCFLSTACVAFTKRGGSERSYLRPLILSTLSCWILATSIGGHSLWTLVFDAVPGAKALRVVSRIQILLSWPVVSIAISGLDWLCTTVHRYRRSVVIVALFVTFYMFIEQINIWQVPALDRSVQMKWLHSIEPYPSQCQAFFASAARPFDARYGKALNDLVGFNIDSMLAAEWLSHPTLNGFATFVPPAWNLLSIDRDDYLDRVRQYADRFGITAKLCGLDLRTGAWNTRPVAR